MGEQLRLMTNRYTKATNFCYFGLIIHDKEEIEDGLSHRIGMGWMKWIGAFRVLRDCHMSIIEGEILLDGYKSGLALWKRMMGG